MYFKNKYINYELRNNLIYKKVLIKKNIVYCDNEIIRNDIESKLNFSINYVEFYVSLYDYNIIKPGYYWESIKNIRMIDMPIYKKDKDFKEYIEWLNINVNNNKDVVYETSKFTKRRYVFNNQEECLKTVKWEQTNPKHKNFNQLLYHGSDKEDLERYGLIYVRTLFNKIRNIEINSTNIWNNTPIYIWEKYRTNYESIRNTMKYMLNKMKKGVLVGIKNNKLVIFLPFSKHNYTNDFYTELFFDENDKKLLKEYKKTKNKEILRKLENNVRTFFYKNKLNLNNILLDRSKWVANDCFFRYENYEGDKLVVLYEHLLRELCKNRKLPDIVFFLNLRDHPVLNRKLKDTYTSIVDKDLDEKYRFKEYAPIFSIGGSDETADIPLVTQDDWYRISQIYFPDDCKNGYINVDEIEIIKWENKKNVAIFNIYL